MVLSHDSLLRSIALLFKALSDENRLRIVLAISEAEGGSLTVSEIVKKLDISQPLVSHHLKELKFAGLLDPERRGPFIHYRLSVPNELVSLLEKALELKDKSIGKLSENPPTYPAIKRLSEEK